MRTLVMALALVAAQGCKKSASEKHADKAADALADHETAATAADFTARREVRYRALDAQLQVIASQPFIINTMAKVFPLTEAGRARVTASLQALQMRFDEAKNLVGLVRTSPAATFKDADDRATAAVKKLDDARKDAWDALDKAPRTDRSS